jgi:hypothetical protein
VWPDLWLAGTVFDHLEFEVQFLSTEDETQVVLPKLSCEAHCRPSLVQVCEEFQAKCPPQIGEGDISPDGLQLDISVKGKQSPVLHKTVERITIKMIAMRRIGGPVGV